MKLSSSFLIFILGEELGGVMRRLRIHRQSFLTNLRSSYRFSCRIYPLSNLQLKRADIKYSFLFVEISRKQTK
uniref:Uncharacterized protein n=1 Tax=Daphnia magna TaxID=35525 RepID=A0A0P6HRN4_9CRUS